MLPALLIPAGRVATPPGTSIVVKLNAEAPEARARIVTAMAPSMSRRRRCRWADRGNRGIDFPPPWAGQDGPRRVPSPAKDEWISQPSLAAHGSSVKGEGAVTG